MIIHYSAGFQRQYRKLPKEMREMVAKKEDIFRKNPFDPRLKTHKLQGILSGNWALSITQKYRIIFKFADEKTVRFYIIGTHDIY